MKIYADDGREFKNVDECNAYEADQKLKKQKEQEERAKAVAKAEADRKVKEEAREKAMKWVTETVDLVNQAVERYEKETGDNVYFINEDGKLKAKTYSTLSRGLVKDFFYFF